MAPSRRRTGRLLALATLLAGLQLTIAAPAASAHAFLVDTSPADGAALDTAPPAVHLRFSESVALDAMTITLVDGHGHDYRPTAVRLASNTPATNGGDGAATTEEPEEVIADLPPLGRDAYRLTWTTLSSDDLHRTSGILVFGVGQQVSAAGSAEPAPEPAEVVLRWAIFLAFAIALGGLLVGRLLARTAPAGPRAATSRCRSWATRAALAGMFACAGLAWFQMTYGGARAQDVLRGAHGLYSLLRFAGFALILVGLRRAVPEPTLPARPVPAAAIVGFAAVAAGTALTGHAGASALSTWVVADAAHLVAGATWAGSLALTALVVLPALRSAPSATVHSVIRGLGVPFAVCVGILAVTGLYLTGQVVGSVDAALLTFYGRTLIGKLFLAGVALGIFGLWNNSRARDPDRRVPIGSVRAEATAGLVVLILAAVLTSSQPAREPQFMRKTAATATAGQDGQVGDIQQAVSIRPNTPGRNVIVVDAFDTRRPSPAPIRSVLIRLIAPDGTASVPTAMGRLGDGHWSATADIPWATAFSLEVTVRRPRLADLVSRRPWALGTRPGSIREPLVSNTPIGPALRDASLVLLVALTVAAVAGWTRAHRRAAGPRRPERRQVRGKRVTGTAGHRCGAGQPTAPPPRTITSGDEGGPGS